MCSKTRSWVWNSLLLQPCRRGWVGGGPGGVDYRRRSLETLQRCAKMWVKRERDRDWSHSMLTGSGTTGLSQSVSEVASKLEGGVVFRTVDACTGVREKTCIIHFLVGEAGALSVVLKQGAPSNIGRGRGSHFICCFCSEHRDIRELQKGKCLQPLRVYIHGWDKTLHLGLLCMLLPCMWRLNWKF